MKLLCVFYFLLFSLIVNSQKLLKGVVFDEIKKQPITNAAVFLNGTTISTLTNEQGRFALNIPNGRYSLVAISSKFQTHYEIINSNKLLVYDTIKLQLKSKQNNVGVYEKNGWEKWGNFFMMNFIGSSANALECKIKNTKAIHFYEEGDELSTFADEPLIIENKALGYTIKYELESFSCNFKTQSLSYAGYSFFIPMDGNATKQKNWKLLRSEAYFGSMMHFMRSVYRNQIAEEGFDIRSLKKVRNITAYQTSQTDSTDPHFIKTMDNTKSTSDSVDDYNDQILNADNYKDVIGTTLTGDSIAYAIDNTTAGLAFNNFLLIVYKGRETPIEYQQQNGGIGMTSQLILVNNKPIEVEANGSYYDPRDLLILGYWTWSEKIANMLPFDYQPLNH